MRIVWQSKGEDLTTAEWSLLWTSHTLLSASRCNITGIKNLTSANIKLLKQLGAKGDPVMPAQVNYSPTSNQLVAIPKNISAESSIILTNAIPILEEELRVLRIGTEPDSLKIAMAQIKIGQACLVNKNFNNALNYLEGAKQLLIIFLTEYATETKLSMDGNIALANCCHELGLAQLGLGSEEAAINSFEEAVDIRNLLIHQIPNELAYNNKVLYSMRTKLFTDRAATFVELGCICARKKNYNNCLGAFNEAYKIYNYHCQRIVYESKHPLVERIKFHLIPLGNHFYFENNMKMAEICYSIVRLEFKDPKTHLRIAYFNKKTNLTKTIEHYRILIDLEPDNSSHYLNIGCYYHVQAIETNNQDLYQKSEAAFQIGMSLEANNSIQVKVEYTIFLIQQKRYQEAFKYLIVVDTTVQEQATLRKIIYPAQETNIEKTLDEFEKALTNIDLSAITEPPQEKKLHYDIVEKCRLPASIQAEIDEFGEITIPTKILAGYLLILISLQLDKKDNLRIYHSQFMNLINNKPKALYLSLAGDISMQLKMYEPARKFFEQALQMKSDYQLVQQNLAGCLKNLSDIESLTNENTISIKEKTLLNTSSTFFSTPDIDINQNARDDEEEQIRLAIAMSLEKN